MNDEMNINQSPEESSRLLFQNIAEFGKGFDISNLRRMRSFYQAFPIQGTLCPELSWSHYRKLIAIEPIGIILCATMGKLSDVLAEAKHCVLRNASLK